jgi:hypothetical protein
MTAPYFGCVEIKQLLFYNTYNGCGQKQENGPQIVGKVYKKPVKDIKKPLIL